MRRSVLALALLLTMTVVASCDSFTGPKGEQSFYSIPGALALVNESDSPLYTIVFSADLAPLVDWVPCIADECGKVEPNSKRWLPVDSIMGAAPGEEVHIYYWRAVVGPADGLVAGPVSFKKLRLDRGLIN